MKDLLVLVNAISDPSSQDEIDVLVQADNIEEAAKKLGYVTRRMSVGLDLGPLADTLENNRPDLVFNLVESIDGKGGLIHLCPSMLETWSIPFTGSGSYAMLATTNKILTKKILRDHGIPTPEWILPGNGGLPTAGKKYISKPVWEDGSAGITDDSVKEANDPQLISLAKDSSLKDIFIEEYIDGREFNISLLAGETGPLRMPVAEMRYLDYPTGKPKILNYASKWDESSFEYHKTIRTFDLSPADQALVESMSEISSHCWKIFDMNGYIRVDFRVDDQNRPWVLEVNVNPCLSPDAGFVAACLQGGLDYNEMVQMIINTAK